MKVGNIMKTFENDRDSGYSEGYQDGLENRKGFTEEDFSENELKMLKLAFALVECSAESRRSYNYDNDEVNAIFDLKIKLKIDSII